MTGRDGATQEVRAQLVFARHTFSVWKASSRKVMSSSVNSTKKAAAFSCISTGNRGCSTSCCGTADVPESAQGMDQMLYNLHCRLKRHARKQCCKCDYVSCPIGGLCCPWLPEDF